MERSPAGLAGRRPRRSRRRRVARRHLADCAECRTRSPMSCERSTQPAQCRAATSRWTTRSTQRSSRSSTRSTIRSAPKRASRRAGIAAEPARTVARLASSLAVRRSRRDRRRRARIRARLVAGRIGRDADADRAERGRIRHGQFRAGAPDRDDGARRACSARIDRAVGWPALARLQSTRRMRAPCTPAPPSRTLAATPTRKLVLTALGVVFGDIGTSPLYALPRVFQSRARHRRHAAEHPRHPVADPVVAGPDHLDQVRRDRAARRQSRRRRRARAEHVAVEREQQLAVCGHR